MKKRLTVLIICLSVLLLLSGFFVVRALLLREAQDAPMEEDELLKYLEKYKVPEEKTEQVADLSFDPQPDGSGDQATPIP